MMDRPRRGSLDVAEPDDATEVPDGASDTDRRTRALDARARGARPCSAEWAGTRRRLLAAIAAPHPLLWLTTLALVVLDAVWLHRAGIRLDPLAPLGVAALVAVLLAVAACLGPIKSEPSLRAMALASASLIAFTVPVAILHYAAATLRLPLIDHALARAERALGFDWPTYLAWLNLHPDLNWWLSLAYHTSGPQIAVVVIVLAATRRLGRLWAFVRLFCATLLCVVVVSAVLPAVGAYAHYAPAELPVAGIETVGALWHLDALERLRAGTFDVLVVGDVRGLVTFPSFHVCLAILTAWALAPVRFVGAPALLLNGAVIVATLGSGGHYLPDLLAGAAVAGGGLLVHRGRRQGLTRRPVRPVNAGVMRPSPIA